MTDAPTLSPTQVAAIRKQLLAATRLVAWKIGGDVDENSPDGKVYTAALDDLTSKCS
jgi:hypothetical protein